ncbi:hypothetical protein F8M41_007279 [Gigaspora margarita]|uniref:Uncharacterized protein n=1 Tax=Gigaspora margarita TaxID=4874 RepID=A0A8H3X867_GIGMA|nr:hypothetical protein F8M41_007279 [Gigaspora margarita]
MNKKLLDIKKSVLENIVNLMQNLNKRIIFKEGLETTGLQIKSKRKRKDRGVEVDEWMSGFSDIVVNTCIKICNEECPEKFDWEDVKNEYNCAANREVYIKNLASWVGQKAATIAKKHNCSMVDVNSKRAAYFLH